MCEKSSVLQSCLLAVAYHKAVATLKTADDVQLYVAPSCHSLSHSVTSTQRADTCAGTRPALTLVSHSIQALQESMCASVSLVDIHAAESDVPALLDPHSVGQPVILPCRVCCSM